MKQRLTPFAAILFLTLTTAEADEFADVDPKRLAQGIEHLAAAWSIPTDGPPGATDDFADDHPVLDQPSTISDLPTNRDGKAASFAQAADLGQYPDGLLSRIGVDWLLGAIRKRRRLD